MKHFSCLKRKCLQNSDLIFKETCFRQLNNVKYQNAYPGDAELEAARLLQQRFNPINHKTRKCNFHHNDMISFRSLPLHIHIHMKSEALLNLMNFPRSGTNGKCILHICISRGCPKNGSERPINGPKMSWFGMVWFCLSKFGKYKMI